MNDEDFTWLTEHSGELIREYAGKWVAIADGEIVGVGETATEAAQRAREKIQAGEFVLERISADADVIYGCS